MSSICSLPLLFLKHFHKYSHTFSPPVEVWKQPVKFERKAHWDLNFNCTGFVYWFGDNWQLWNNRVIESGTRNGITSFTQYLNCVCVCVHTLICIIYMGVYIHIHTFFIFCVFLDMKSVYRFVTLFNSLSTTIYIGESLVILECPLITSLCLVPRPHHPRLYKFDPQLRQELYQITWSVLESACLNQAEPVS